MMKLVDMRGLKPRPKGSWFDSRYGYCCLNSSVGRAQGWKLWGRWFKSNLRHLVTKLFFSKLLSTLPHVFLKSSTFRSKVLLLLLPDSLVYYVSLHLKLATAAQGTQLIDIFAYEVIKSSSAQGTPAGASAPVLVYHFHNLSSQDRLLLFSSGFKSSNTVATKSLAELYSCSVWLEREVGEMHALAFTGQKDLRNLMLQYGDSSAPFRKSYPSIGTREVVYDSVTDNLVQVPISLQI